jgi:hypothetical protein
MPLYLIQSITRSADKFTFIDQDNDIVYKNTEYNDVYIHEECLKGLDYMTAGVRLI